MAGEDEEPIVYQDMRYTLRGDYTDSLCLLGV